MGTIAARNVTTLKIAVLMAVLLLVECQSPLNSSEIAEQEVIQGTAQKLIDDLIQRKEMRWYRSEHLTGFHYAEAVAVFGALQLAQKLDDIPRLTALQQKYLNISDYDKLADFHHVDGNVIGIVPLQLYRSMGDEKLKQQGLSLADAQWKNPLPNGMTSQSRYWIDDIYMINALQMQAYRVTDQRQYLDRAAHNTREYLRKIQQPNGLFWHGPEAHFFWGRGNGWVAAGIAELLRELPHDHSDYPFIAERFSLMMQSLLPIQAPDGLWRQLLDQPTAWQETSATAMFAWAMLIGIQQGILVENQYQPTVKRAWAALLNKLQEDGRLTDICAGTGQSKDINYYLERPRITGDLHGQAPLLWLLATLLDDQH